MAQWSLVFPSIHVILRLLYKEKSSQKKNKIPIFINLVVGCEAIIFTREITTNNFTCAIISFYQCPKFLQDTILYIIKYIILCYLGRTVKTKADKETLRCKFESSSSIRE